jgi:hypothetical protein
MFATHQRLIGFDGSKDIFLVKLTMQLNKNINQTALIIDEFLKNSEFNGEGYNMPLHDDIRVTSSRNPYSVRT